ncbi:MAG: hypothetical protein ACLP01_04620 [Solirubrobacteraceae bacterium]
MSAPTDSVPGDRAKVTVGFARARDAVRKDRGSALLVLAASLCFLVSIAQAPSTIHQLYRDADSVSGFIEGQLAGNRPNGTIIDLGNHDWYEVWWFQRATVGLPGHLVMWELFPFFLDFLGVAVVCYAVAKTTGTRAALITAVILLAVGNAMRQIVFEPTVRVEMLVHLGILSLALTAAWQRARRGALTLRWACLTGALLGVFTAAGGTDQLLMFDGVVPFVAAAWMWFWRNRSRGARNVALYATGIGAVSVVGSTLIAKVMSDAGVSASLNLNSFAFIPSSALPSYLGGLLSAWTALGDGTFWGAPVNRATDLEFLLGILTLAALAAVLWSCVRTMRAWWVEQADAPAAAERGAADLFVSFWGLSVVMTMFTYATTSVAPAGDSRYLLAAWVGTAALLGAFARSRQAQIALIACTLLFAAVTVRDNLSHGVPPPGIAYPETVVAQIKDFVLAHDARVGYAAYGYSHNLTWATGFKVKAFPVWACPYRPESLCQRPLSSISSWFIPRLHTNTFLITGGGPAAVAGPPAAFGKPIASHTFDAYTVWIYGHDVAAEIQQY